MSTEEEQAALLRVIAANGYSPWEDQDGSTAAALEEIAVGLQMSAPPPKGRHPIRRWWLRLRLRLKLRWLGLVPVIALCWATVEVRALVAQTPPDSLYQLPTVRAALGTWAPTRIWCVTRAADYGTLLVLVSVTPADSTRCQRSDGTRAPLFIDAEECPPATFDPGQFPFVIVRCAADDYRKFQRRQPERRTQ
jgi:hypothetical protein